MSKRMSTHAYCTIRALYPDDVSKMATITIEVSDFNRFRYRKRRKKRTNTERYGEQLTEILEWLDENCNDHYYPRTANKVFDKSVGYTAGTNIDFLFMDETDALGFKLCFS